MKFRFSRPVLQLLRPPNLFTVPGDPLCGALLASHGVWSWRIVPAIIASLACYCFGLVINDIADFKEDLRERPHRPLPSGAVSRKLALKLAVGFAALAVASTFFLSGSVKITVMLLLTTLWYNFSKGIIPFLAPISMGLCRGLSVLIGASAIGVLHIFSFFTILILRSYFPSLQPPPLAIVPLAAAAFITLYIAGVAALARTETRNPRIPPLIGSLIRGLLFIQAGFCLYAGGSGWIAALLLLALWPISRLVASHFYAS